MLLYNAEIPVPLSNETFHIRNRNTGIDIQKTQSTTLTIQDYMDSISSNSALAEAIFLLCTIITTTISLHPFRTARSFGTTIEFMEILSIVGGILACLSFMGMAWIFQKTELTTNTCAIILTVNLTICVWLYRHLFTHGSVRKYGYGHKRDYTAD